MKMNKTTAARIFWVGAGVCILSSALYFMGILPLTICASVLIPAFPVTILALFFWWMAGQSGGDIPFIGY
jgi:hypothetical protein